MPFWKPDDRCPLEHPVDTRPSGGRDPFNRMSMGPSLLSSIVIAITFLSLLSKTAVDAAQAKHETLAAYRALLIGVICVHWAAFFVYYQHYRVCRAWFGWFCPGRCASPAPFRRRYVFVIMMMSILTNTVFGNDPPVTTNNTNNTQAVWSF